MNSMNNGGGAKSSPSLFDIGLYLFTFLAPICFWLPWEYNMFQRLFFVFGIFALCGLGFLSEKQRECDTKYLGILILLSLLNVFIHTFSFSLTESYVVRFINFAILSQGFIYVLCGCLLYYLVVTYKKNFVLFYPILAINILNLFFVITQKVGIHLIWIKIPTICGMMGTSSQLVLFSAASIPILCHHRWNDKLKIWIPFVLIPIAIMCLVRSYTAYCALVLVTVYYCFRIKNKFRAFTILVLGIIVGFYYYSYFVYKIKIRLDLWIQTILDIIKHPFVGWGFDNSLAKNMVYCKIENALTYRHNDFLNIARDLGLPFLITIIYGIKSILSKAKVNYLWASIWIVLIACFFQTNAYFPRIATVGIILLALQECKNYDTKI